MSCWRLTVWRSPRVSCRKWRSFDKSMSKSCNSSWRFKRLIFELRWTKRSAKKILSLRKWLLSSKAECNLCLAPEISNLLCQSKSTLKSRVTTVSTVIMFLGRPIFGSYFQNTKKRNSMNDKQTKSPNF